MRRLGFILLLPWLLLAQPDFFGYFESEASTMQLGTHNYTFGFNKFRLDVEARPNEHVLIGANINIQHYWGKTTWNFFDFVPGYSESGMVLNVDLPDTLLLDNAYMKIAFPSLDLTVGRQQISLGVGYAWNPTDIFNHKSLLDPSYEQTGIQALRLDLPLSNRSSLIAIVQPEAKLDRSTQQYILKGGVGSFDFSATTSFQANSDFSTTILGYSSIKERRLFGGSIVGEIGEWGIWGEFGYNILNTFPVSIPEESSHFGDNTETAEYVLGTDHTFDNSLYFLAEYLHNGIGVAKKEDLTLNDYFAALSGESQSLMQDYAFFYLMHPTFDLVSLSALVIANFNDNSGTFAPQLDWSVFQNTNISLQGSLFWGADDTEFGLQDWGMRLRVRSDF